MNKICGALVLILAVSPQIARADTCSGSGLTITCDNYYSNVANDIATTAVQLFSGFKNSVFTPGSAALSTLETAHSYNSNDIGVLINDGSFPSVFLSINLYTQISGLTTKYYAQLSSVEASVLDSSFLNPLNSNLSALPGTGLTANVLVDQKTNVSAVPGPIAGTGAPALLLLAGLLQRVRRRGKEAA